MTWQKGVSSVKKDGEKWTVLNVYGTRINKIWHLRLWMEWGDAQEGDVQGRNLKQIPKWQKMP